jgi:hypothetical protein
VLESRGYRVFLSYTGEDLSAHADLVAAVLRKLEIIAIDHRGAGGTGELSVQWCMENVDRCDLLIILLAHRYGWIPSSEEGGDGEASITWLEVKRARSLGKTVLPYLVDDKAPWPADKIEPLSNPGISSKLRAFRDELRKSFVGFFSDPASLDGPVSRSVPQAIERLRAKQSDRPNPSPAVRERVVPTSATLPWIYDRNFPPSVLERMNPSLPKRILSINGGYATAMAFGYLERIERLLQVRYQEPDFRLSDYFDLISGQGSAAVVAADLATGKSVAQVLAMYKSLFTKRYAMSPLRWGAANFGCLAAESLKHLPGLKASWLRFPYPTRIDSKACAQALSDYFGDVTLGSDAFRTGLAILTTQLDTGLPYFFFNHPQSGTLEGSVPIHQVLLGAVASYPLLSPVLVDAGGKRVAIYEGAASMGFCPTLSVLSLASSKQYPFRWRLGEYSMYMVSVGAVPKALGRPPEDVVTAGPLDTIGLLFNAQNFGIEHTHRALLEVLSTDDIEGATTLRIRTFTHKRYEIDGTPETLAALGMPELPLNAMEHGDFAAPSVTEQYLAIGHTAAERSVRAADFIAAFDVREASNVLSISAERQESLVTQHPTPT